MNADLTVVAIALIIAVGVVWRPTPSILLLGVFLFVQSAVVRLQQLPPSIREPIGRLDEIVLAALVVRVLVLGVPRRRLRFPAPLWAMVAFGVVGVVSAIANRPDPLAAALGLFLAGKPAMWLLVVANMTIEPRTVVRYGYLLAGLFVAAVGVAVLQFIGVEMPWELHRRPSGDFAATSIWNQHTVFGSALAVAIALAVATGRLRGERRGAPWLGAVATVGILLSSVRRLLVSLPVAALVTIQLVPADQRDWLKQAALSIVRRRLPVIGIGIAAVVLLLGPRLARLTAEALEQYVFDPVGRDRFELYRGAVEILGRSPLLGRGPGSYGSYPTVLVDSPVYSEVGVRVADHLKMGAPYASLAAEFGIYGIFAFAIFLVLLIRLLIPLAGREPVSIQGALASAGILMIVNMSIESIVHVVFTDSFTAFFVFGGIGAALSLAASPAVSGGWDPLALTRQDRSRPFLGGVGLIAGLLLIGVAVS